MIWQADSDKISNSLCAFDLKFASGLTQAWCRHSEKSLKYILSCNHAQALFLIPPNEISSQSSTSLLKSCGRGGLNCRRVLGSFGEQQDSSFRNSCG